MKKLESVYGNVRTAESVMEEFYSSMQTREEGVSAWDSRLKGLVQTVVEKGTFLEYQREDMLKKRFWKHLYNEDLKNVTRLAYETSKTFEELRFKVRREEQELQTMEKTHLDKTQKSPIMPKNRDR